MNVMIGIRRPSTIVVTSALALAPMMTAMARPITPYCFRNAMNSFTRSPLWGRVLQDPSRRGAAAPPDLPGRAPQQQEGHRGHDQGEQHEDGDDAGPAPPQERA